MPRLAANVSLLFREWPLIERFGAAAQAGFDAVECLWPYEVPVEQARAEIERHGLTVALINTPAGAGDDAHFGLAASASRRDGFCASFNEALRYAVGLGAPGVHIMVGEWERSPQNPAALVANLREAGAKAEQAGLFLAIEPINARDRPRWFLRSTAQALEILDEVASPAVRLQFEFYPCRSSRAT